MAKNVYVCTMLHDKPAMQDKNGNEVFLDLPKGCAGILFVWDNLDDAKEWHGEKAGFLEMETIKNGN